MSNEETEKSFDHKLFRLQKEAQEGIAEAQYDLGLIYAKGLSVAKNETRAFELFSLAAAQGHARSQHNVGVMYEKGLGTEQNILRAVEFLKKSASQGEQASIERLIEIYRSATKQAADELSETFRTEAHALQPEIHGLSIDIYDFLQTHAYEHIAENRPEKLDNKSQRFSDRMQTMITPGI